MEESIMTWETNSTEGIHLDTELLSTALPLDSGWGINF